jgi:uncharacterized membrane protein YebE (DUF533 family)
VTCGKPWRAADSVRPKCHARALDQFEPHKVAVQLYAASLLAIVVDAEPERRYLRRLAHGLGLEASVVRCVHGTLGMDRAQPGGVMTVGY